MQTQTEEKLKRLMREIREEIEHKKHALAVLEGLVGPPRRGRKPDWMKKQEMGAAAEAVAATEGQEHRSRVRRQWSPAQRAQISRRMRAYWQNRRKTVRGRVA